MFLLLIELIMWSYDLILELKEVLQFYFLLNVIL